jgi:hypothetical protein
MIYAVEQICDAYGKRPVGGRNRGEEQQGVRYRKGLRAKSERTFFRNKEF